MSLIEEVALARLPQVRERLEDTYLSQQARTWTELWSWLCQLLANVLKKVTVGKEQNIRRLSHYYMMMDIL